MATVIPFPVARIRTLGDPDWTAIDAVIEKLERERGLDASGPPRLRLVPRPDHAGGQPS